MAIGETGTDVLWIESLLAASSQSATSLDGLTTSFTSFFFVATGFALLMGVVVWSGLIECNSRGVQDFACILRLIGSTSVDLCLEDYYCWRDDILVESPPSV